MCQLAAEKVCIPFLLDEKATLILPESYLYSGKDAAILSTLDTNRSGHLWRGRGGIVS